MNTGKIVVIGSSNVDLVMKMAHLPKQGETVTNAIFMQAFGGKGANQAVAAAKAGGEVYFVACVGDDRFGRMEIENLNNSGVNTATVFQEPGVASGSALIMVGGSGEINVEPVGGLQAGLGNAQFTEDGIPFVLQVVGVLAVGVKPREGDGS